MSNVLPRGDGCWDHEVNQCGTRDKGTSIARHLPACNWAVSCQASISDVWSVVVHTATRQCDRSRAQVIQAAQGPSEACHAFQQRALTSSGFRTHPETIPSDRKAGFRGGGGWFGGNHATKPSFGTQGPRSCQRCCRRMGNHLHLSRQHRDITRGGRNRNDIFRDCCSSPSSCIFTNHDGKEWVAHNPSSNVLHKYPARADGGCQQFHAGSIARGQGRCRARPQLGRGGGTRELCQRGCGRRLRSKSSTQGGGGDEAYSHGRRGG